MLAPKSTHKRKRSSTRSDKARKLGPARWIVNLLPSAPTAQPSTSSDNADPSPSNNKAGPSRTPRLHNLIDAHPFSRSLELILPLTSSSLDSAESSSPLPPGVTSLIDRLNHLTSSHRSYLARIPLSLLLDPIFITAYLKTGSLIALSSQPPSPGLSSTFEDTACIDGQGTLILSLCKDTYQTLGLTGRASHFSRLSSGRAADRTSGPDSRFIVELPLLSPSFVPGKKGYQQALGRLRAWDRARAQGQGQGQKTVAESHASSQLGLEGEVTSEHATWDMSFVWSASRANAEAIRVSGSGSGEVNEIRFPEHLVRSQDVESLALQPLAPVITDSVWIPTFSDPTQHSLGGPWRENERHFCDLEPSPDSNAPASWSDWQNGLEEAIEWACLASLAAPAIRTFTKPDSTCVYSPPSLSTPGRIVKLTWSGPAGKPLLLSPLLISQIAAEVDGFIAQSSAKEGESCRWATLSVSGFPHAPLTWRAKKPLSEVYGAKDLPGTKSAKPKLAGEMMEDTDVSSSEDEDEDAESDSSLNMGEKRKQKKKKKRSKRNVGKNQTEHTFTPSTGETGWVSFCLSSKRVEREKEAAGNGEEEGRARWVFVELVGTDTRS